MKKAFLFTSVLLACVLLFVSCELTGTAPSKGTLHVVAMGDNFTGRSDIKSLSSCENDAEAVCQVFDYWGKKAGMETDIHNCSGTYCEGFDNTLDEVCNSARDNDLTVIFISTHGSNEIKRPVPYSSSNTDNAFFVLEKQRTTELAYIYDSELMEVAQATRGKVLILADFCYSGAVIPQDNFTYNRLNYTDSGPLTLFFDSTPATDSNKVFILASSTYYEQSWAGFPLSAFTNCLLRSMGLVSYNASTDTATVSSDAPVLKHDRIILSDVYNYVYKQTSPSQTPQMNTGASDLILFSL